MTFPGRTPEGKAVLYNAATGERIERWPVDARGMVDSKEWLMAPPGTPVPEPDAAATPTAAPAVVGSPVMPPVITPNPLGIPNVTTHAHEAEPGKPFAGPTRVSGKSQTNRMTGGK